MRAAPLPSYLQRAIVSLPQSMCDRERPLQERIVFFEAYTHERGERLERLLALAWNTDTTDWCERGYIYNLTSAHERIHCGESFLDPKQGDLCMFDTGCGGDGPWAVGKDCMHFARAEDIDLFVTPRLAERLRKSIAAIEAMYAAEPQRRASAKAAA